jgi:hypothetical protein
VQKMTNLPTAKKSGRHIRNRGKLVEFRNEEDIVEFLKGLGLEEPRIYQPTSVLMTGWFNAYDKGGRHHVYGCWRNTVAVSADYKADSAYIFEVWEMEE